MTEKVRLTLVDAEDETKTDEHASYEEALYALIEVTQDRWVEATIDRGDDHLAYASRNDSGGWDVRRLSGRHVVDGQRA